MRLTLAVCLLSFSATAAVAQPAAPGAAPQPAAPDAYTAQSQQERSAAYAKERADYDLQVRVMSFAAGCKVIAEDAAEPPVAAAGVTLAAESKRLGVADDVPGLTKTALQAGRTRAEQPNACHYWHDHPDAAAFVQAHVAPASPSHG